MTVILSRWNDDYGMRSQVAGRVRRIVYAVAVVMKIGHLLVNDLADGSSTPAFRSSQGALLPMNESDL